MQKGAQSNNKRAMRCLILFALPFAGGGLFAAYLVISTLWAWNQVQDWIETSAHILNVDLISQRGDDSTTYRVEALYEYHFRSGTFTSQRVGLSGGSDNVGSFHQDVHAELSRYQRSGKPFRCYVNPENPDQAILYRKPRWGLLSLKLVFALAFGGVGFGLIAAARYGGRKLKAEQRLKQMHPDQPWRWKQEWVEGRINASAKTRMIVSWVFAGFWNLISIPLLFIIPEEARSGNSLALIGLLFPVVGVGLLAWAGHSLIRWRKYGRSTFEMSSVPGVRGGTLEGRILTSGDLRPEDGFHVILSCVERRTTGSGKNRSTSESVLWQRAKVVGPELLERQTAGWTVPVRFGVPYELPSTDVEESTNRVLWRLEAAASVPGVDYAAQFEVPVFATDKSDSKSSAHEVAQADADSPDTDEALRTAGIATENVSGGTRYLFKPARHVRPALGMTVFVLFWTGAIVFMLQVGAPLFFPIVFSLFDLLLLWGTLDLWVSVRRVVVAREALSFSGGLLGLGRTHTVPVDDIAALKAVRGMQAGNHLYYRIQMTTRDKKKHTLATQLQSLQLAQSLIRRFEQVLQKQN